MLRSLASACSILALFAATGCSSFLGSSEPPTTTIVMQAPTGGAEQVSDEKSATAELADAFAHVLDNPGAAEFNKPDPFMPKGTYSYAIVEVTGDDRPDLLLQADVTDYYAPITVFSKPKDQPLFNTREVLVAGAGSAGGGRADVLASATGNGLYQSLWSSMDRTAKVEKYVVQDQKLVKAGGEERLPTTSQADAEHLKINWTPVTDRSALDGLKGNGGAPANAAPSQTVEKCGISGGFTVFTGTSATSCQFAKAVATAVAGAGNNGPSFTVDASSPVTGQNYSMACTQAGEETVCSGGNNAKVVMRPAAPGEQDFSKYDYALEGTVVLQSTPEHIAYLGDGRKAPNNEPPTNEYILLMLDSPQRIRATKASVNFHEATPRHVGLGRKETNDYGTSDETGPWRQYIGKRIRLHINSKDMYYQTDASLPMEGPRVCPKASDYEVEVL